jgi:beta-N-acetylhexosaminidase
MGLGHTRQAGLAIAVAAALAAAAACGPGRTGPAAHPGAAAHPGRAGASAAGLAERAAVAAQAAAITSRMSLPQKVGQLLVATVPGTSAADGGAALVRAYHLGGVIYFGTNITGAAQVARLSNGLQQAALAQRPALPLLIGTDQEGGIVARLAGLGTGFPGQMAAGATRSTSLIRAEEHQTAAELAALGINLDYAPVADVNTDPANPVIGIRSFGADPALVAAMTSAAVAGFHAGGVAATAKHFPGHGDTGTDSHTGLPVIRHTLRQWWRLDAPPFRAAIAAGVDEIMAGQIAVPALDPARTPASLSYRIVTGYLRDRLGYSGVVTTDALDMAGVTIGHTNAQIAVQAVQAGCDQLLMPVSVGAAYQALLAAVHDGRISTARLDASVRRIVELKLTRGLMGRPPVSVGAAAGHENPPAGQAVASAIARRSVTLVANHLVAGKRRALPLAGRRVYLAGPQAAALAAPLRAALGRTGGSLAATPSAAAEIVVATQDAAADPAQRSLVASLAATGRPVVVVATGVPYDLGLFAHMAAGLATYSAVPASLAAAAQALTGQLDPAGALPAAIPGADGGTGYRYGTGLHY